jgi:hypothetical protein
MLTIRVEGDKHPRTFVFVTDDANAELAELDDVLKCGDANEEDPLYAWFTSAMGDRFKQGVPIPADLVGDFQEVLWAYGSAEADAAAEVIDNERQSWMDEIES